MKAQKICFDWGVLEDIEDTWAEDPDHVAILKDHGIDEAIEVTSLQVKLFDLGPWENITPVIVSWLEK